MVHGLIYLALGYVAKGKEGEGVDRKIINLSSG
jgi:hypothetical protein